jgi:hypothetical protein
LIKETIGMRDREGGVIVLSYEKLQALIPLFLTAFPVDDEWYKARYPDVAGNIASGIEVSANAHYVEHGYFEGRLPRDVEVDESWYLVTYPDVAEGSKTGGPPAKQHYLDFGYNEGRQPAPKR